jgi:hypothetical protein
MFHSVITHWYPLWCEMWMWIHLWLFAPYLNRWVDGFVDYVVLVGFPTPCLSICFGLHEFSYGWSINAPTTFYNSTCLVIPILMWKDIKGQSMIICLSSSQNAKTLESNLTTIKSTYSWSYFLAMYFVWSNFRFPWCEYGCGTSSNTFTCAFAYSDDCR